MRNLLTAITLVMAVTACGGEGKTEAKPQEPLTAVLATTPTPTTTPTTAPVYLPEPISGSVLVKQDVMMSGVSYPDSITVNCPIDDLNWNATGYKTFTATIGIPDDDPNGLGETATVTFLDQDNHQLGDPVKAALGKPQQVTVNLNGAIRLQVICKAKPGDYAFNFALGNGAFHQ